MHRSWFCILASCVALGLVFTATAGELTLPTIMADQDWLGKAPQRPYWADDGRSIYYTQEKVDEEGDRDLIQMDLEGNVIRTVPDADLGLVDHDSNVLSPNRLKKAYARNGDLFIKDLATGHITQLTRTSGAESAPRFLMDADHLAFNRGRAIVVRNLVTNLEYELADLRAEADPEERRERTDDFLVAQQKKLLDIIRIEEERRDAARKRTRAQAAADATRLAAPYYLGANLEIVRSTLLPREDYLLVVVRDSRQAREGKRAIMPNYVTESGDVTTRNVRSKVGTGKPATDELRVLDLRDHKIHKIDLSVLPGIEVDPLASLSKSAKKSEDGDDKDADKSEEKSDTKARSRPEAKPKPRTVAIGSFDVSDDGRQVLVQCTSHDNKDRWIARVDLSTMKLVPLFRECHPGWIRSFGVDWLPDSQRCVFVTEESGYAHLMVADVATGKTRALTSGDYEVSSTHVSRDGKYVYFRANKEHPGRFEIYRVAIDSGKIEQLTKLGGSNTYVLSPNESQLLITHSETTKHGDLFLQPVAEGATAKRLTNTMGKAFTEIPWIAPQVVAVPSSHGKPVYSRLYTPADGSHKTGPKRPAVFFIHGAGYLQDAHEGWSSYTHEFMFHTLLVQKGYVVLDMDYRGSAGYGAAWRTAVYRQMGTPEVEDLADGIAWLAKEHNVDANRVGCYGGSYGGFLTLMALFTKPDLFACGAALRPVTDWAHYNHGYTANILNIPSVDPEAYEKSSPIYFAEGLKKPLLICHGMQDDNVFFEDSVRLAQRLIELKKENWELAIYPVEAHGFRQASSWLDEYRRILALFEQHLK